jgi:hypothetical protein
MKRSGKQLLVLLLNLLILGLGVCGLEFKLAHDRRQEEMKWAGQVRPFYWSSFHTHDGPALGTRSGP